jgi:hypothetical protein
VSATLNNVSTPNDYTAAATLNCEGAVKVNLIIYNAAIYYQLRTRSDIHPRQGTFAPEVGPVPPTPNLSIPRNCDAVRVRSAAAGVPAVVSIEALSPGE